MYVLSHVVKDIVMTVPIKPKLDTTQTRFSKISALVWPLIGLAPSLTLISILFRGALHVQKEDLSPLFMTVALRSVLRPAFDPLPDRSSSWFKHYNSKSVSMDWEAV